MKATLAALVAVLALLLAGAASAHESRPLFVEITERAPGLFLVEWRAPLSVPNFNVPEPVLPDACAAAGPRSPMDDPGAYAYRQLYRCADGLSGQVIEIHFPVMNPSISSLVRLERHSGEVHTALLGPDETTWTVPDRETWTGVARQYLTLGVEHILKGYDHLLFLACLMLIARTWRRILVTITGFTLAHSLTLALAALGVVRIPLPPVEAAIALSIVFLAVEIARGRRDTLTYRYPIAVSASFGLLHGLGFAAVLGEIGLPQTEIPAALLFFNVGVEIGQVLFAGGLTLLVVLALIVVRRLRYRGQHSVERITKLQLPAAYVVGSLAAFWMVGRMSVIWF